MKKLLVFIILLLIIVGIILFWRQGRGALPALRGPSDDIADLIGTGADNPLPQGPAGITAGNLDEQEQPPPPQIAETRLGTVQDGPLTLREGFQIHVIAEDLQKPRVLALDADQNIWVSEIGAGAVIKITMREGVAVARERAITGLRKPHGLAFDPGDPNILYVAEEHRISRVSLRGDGAQEELIALPTGGRHTSRTIRFGPDGKLYISIGSSCDTCYEADERRAAIYSMERDGSDFKLFAKGLRNTVFFDWDGTGRMWGTDMGRDFLGDELPPDEVNIITDGGDYGWPLCYGKNAHDTRFDTSAQANPCVPPRYLPSHIDLPAHSAPLGITFIPTDGWPAGWGGDLLIAYHGSWNRTTPTGYKITRLRLDARGNYLSSEDFISGWLAGKSAIGRPVDLLALPGGMLYVSDDHAGVIYRVTYLGS